MYRRCMYGKSEATILRSALVVAATEVTTEGCVSSLISVDESGISPVS